MYIYMKGQSAIEYLMTYGWMLLVVAVVGGLIFSIVQDQSLEQVSGFEGEEMQVENFGVSSDNNLSLQVLNARRGTVELSNVTVEGEDGMKYTDEAYMNSTEPIDEPFIEMGSQESMEIVIPDFNNTESGQSFEVKLVYDKEGLSNLVSQGRITGTLSMLNTD
jgi:hypothetical protein